uniref:CRACD like n=1 Tax=Panthera tigris altaica TaxID=74533 RepID=A0A8C9M6N9_PANTA
MISTRVMDIKLREAAEGLGEDSTGKKKSKFKTFKKFFGKKKRKESPSSTGNSTWKQSQAKSEVIAIESGPVGYDSEDELEESRGALGSRALSHDSIFIPESGQDPTRPVRVFSQENVCDRIKALQLKIQCNVKMGPPPPPGGLPAKRGDDTGMSSEDDGLPRSPPEMSLHDIGPGTTIKVSLVSSSRHASDASVSPRTSDSSVAPVADFDYPPEFSSCLDNSAAKHKLLVKPRNQRSSKMRRLSSRAQSESLSDLTCTPEEEEYDDKSLPKVSTEENPNSAQQDVGLDRSPEPGGLATMLQSGGPRARRARLQHCPALSASAEEESFLGDNTSSRPATPEVIESESGPVPRAESPSLPEGSPHHHHNPDSEIQREEPSLESTSPPARETADEVICASGDIEIRLSPSIPEGDTTPPETDPAITSETPPGLDGPDQSVQKEVELTLEAPEPEGAGKGSPEAPAPSPSAPKSCLKHKPTSGEDRGPFAVKLRSTSLSFKHREASSAEARGIKRYSAEIRLERGGLALLPKDEKCQVAKAPSPRGARSPHEQGKGKARPSEPLSSPCRPRTRAPGSWSRPRETRSAETRSQHRAAEKGPPPAAEGQPAPPWITIARQKRRGTPNQPPNQEDKPGVRTLKSEIGKQAKAPERAQEPMKQADFVRSKSFLIAPAKPTVDRRQGTKLRLQEGLQRGISLSHQNLAAQSAVMTEKELHQLKRASYASADQPSWMELARKKSQAWSDMPQIIK